MTQITVDRAVIADMLFASQSLPSCQAGAIVQCKCQVCAGGRARAALNAKPVAAAAPVQRKPLTMQPITQDEHGVIRFKKNALVDTLYRHGIKTGLGLNELHRMDFTDDDRQQFAQLIGYSVSGYGSLSYVSDDAYESAAAAAHGITAHTIITDPAAIRAAFEADVLGDYSE